MTRWVLTAVLLLVAFGIACGGGRESPTEPSPDQSEPPVSGVIAFQSDRTGHRNTFTIETDGSNLNQLTSEGSVPGDWSPDGRQILLAGDAFSGANFAVVDASTGDVVRLVRLDSVRRVTHLNWSPDGDRIAFVGRRPEGVGELSDRDIYTVTPDGSSVTRLTDNPGLDGLTIDWSPDGNSLVYISERDPLSESGIFRIDWDGSNQQRLTEGFGSSPSWSPDGDRIVFNATFENNKDIYTVNSDGTDLMRLTSNPAFDRSPRWSPDGNKIAFESNRDGNTNIYVINPDGSGVRALTTHESVDSFDDWSPKGEAVVFRTPRTGKIDIYVIGVDGNNLFRVTDDPAFDSNVHWRP